VPRVARYADKEFIVGLGLDELLEEEKNVILLDEDFGDMYGDYLFLGYNVFAETIDTTKADIVGIYTARMLLGKGKSVTVCGKDPVPCTVSLAAYIALEKHIDVLDALREAWNALREIYDRDRVAIPAQLVSALRALKRITSLIGEEAFSALFSLAASYEYGYGRLSYGDLVAWLNNLGASDEALLAGAMSFLALSLHGPPGEILKYRLEAVGESSLVSLIGPRAEKAIAILTRFAENNPDADAALLQFLVHLGPGTDSTLYVDLVNSTVYVYCAGTEPTRECLTKIQNAERVREKILEKKLASIKLVLGEPEPLVIA